MHNDASSGAASAGEQVVVYSSVQGLLVSAVSPALLVTLGLIGANAGGLRPIPLTFLLLGTVLGAALARNLPLWVRFDRTGLTRRCLLRTHQVPWSAVARVERGPGRIRSRVPGPTDEPAATDPEQRPVTGGLLARGHGRRSWMLTDRVESREEFDAWSGLVMSVPEGPEVIATRPHPGTLPSDLYRRRR